MKSVFELLYAAKTRRHFDPVSTLVLTRDDLELVLQGKIKNPHRRTSAGLSTDYGFFVVSAPEISMPARFDPSFVSNFESATWYGIFNCESNSSIVVPMQNEYYLAKDHKCLVKVPLRVSVWDGGGMYQVDKRIGDRILTTDVDLTDLEKILKKTFP